jgi:hypothetical protein
LKRHRARTIAGLASVLLVCLALIGCGQQGSTVAPTGPFPQASGSPAIGNGNGNSAGGISSPGITAAPTQDPVASELDQLNQLINDIDNSVQNSDSSSQGGE